MKDFVVTGRIDLVLEGPEGCEVIDFKTGSSTELSRERVETQLDIYCLGAERSLGLDVHRSTVRFLRSGDTVSVEWNGDRREGAEKALESLLSCVREGELPPDRSFCGYCNEYRGLCPWVEGGEP
jgi:CRISPR/Cas system-associated exonuclease Cas4 (RecB family)